ncbi:hypothetical protein SDRG_07351 [Saprolegnia diclina VS20]|uniref:Isopenicillin N synthase-like Fe(2+) 2OG dioxygenase domain-containing protein n=1 Tax=Saprolegnia diclina (strain VS20) TaxID=1156394 RepID=T0RXQ1_SAPDV|nr:hypothetical protein SDRG_07351 [Saprolegnia diclina VS20]EQC35117.1 hypothetical protein SDRG_07351 [Saprolegnia diclina VS20]|eukprot:XP_008611401.1 hypothetical protein SDRG_07351 [Saprolegnia diclina VS20]
MVQIADLPVIDLAKYMADRANGVDQCNVVADCLHKYGVLVVRDPRATEANNNTFVDMMERYFEQTDFTQDARPELSYQVGVTPEHQERARNHCSRAEALAKEHQPVTLCPPELDKKSRFFWRTGPRPPTTQFTELNAEPVVPTAFPEWEATMDMWGEKMLAAVHELVEMAAIGLGLEKDAFQKRMQHGPHLLAPTGSNFAKYGNLNDVLAGYHYDLNLLTIHGKSRFRGLYIWLRNGEKALVRVPDGCLLVQAGKQIEYLTGGYLVAGFHEVVVTEQTLEDIAARKALGKSLWRVSSTLFSHINSDDVLQPIGRFATPDALDKYPPMLTGHHVRKELEYIELGKGFTLQRDD